MEINGLPLHPLVVHAAVVLGPVAALAALAHAVRPVWRARLRLPMVGLAVLSVAATVAAYLTGRHFKEANQFFAQGEIGRLVHEHEKLAGLLLWVTVGFGVVAVATAALHRQSAGTRGALNAVLAIAALAVLVLVFLTGEAGARATWDGIRG
ncbi:hypothetical protein BH11ACT8_BH11ACT8_08140 [soil metagenome]